LARVVVEDAGFLSGDAASKRADGAGGVVDIFCRIDL